MINNSIHLTELQSPVQTINSRVELYSGSTLVTECNCYDTLRDFSITRAGSENKFFGFGICQKAQIHLIDMDRAITISKTNTAKIAFGARGEYIYTVPTFKIDDIQRDEVSNDITLTTYDVLYGAANHQVSELGLRAPYTIQTVAQACATFLGVGFKIANVGDDSFAATYPTGANLDGTETIRELLDAIAEVTQTIYYIDQTDALVFKRLDAHGDSVLTITKRDYYELKAHDPHTLAAIASATELGDNLEATYDGAITGVGATQYIRNNPFLELLESTAVATKLQGAVAAMGGIVANPYECSWCGNYLLEVGDKISFVREDDSIVTSFLLDDALDYSGIFEEKSNWLFKENEAETPTNPITIGEALNKTYAMVDKIEKEIKLYVGEVVNESVNELVGDAVAETMGDLQQDMTDMQLQLTQTNAKVSELTLTTEAIDLKVTNVETTQEALSGALVSTEERLGNLEISADGINSSVSTLQKNIEETNGQIEAQTAQLRTEIQQSSESVQIEIQNIKEEGANKVVTKTGYTFDDDGLTVSKSTSGVSTQITHDGMTVSEYNTELLTADSKGVSAKDLHARTYLIIGGNSRFEDYNSNRTACFWVGN